MSDTPETDAFIASQDYSPTGHQWRNFTRKLERERDEAREALREGWLAMDEIAGTDRINNWQNKYANILEDAK